MSKGTLYLYYPSEEELLKAVIREHLSSRIAAGAAEAEKHRGTAADLLREVFSRWWLEVFDSPTSGVFKLIITEVRNFPDLAEFYSREVVLPGEQLIARIVQRGIDSGEFDEPRRGRRRALAGAADGDAVPAQAFAGRVRRPSRGFLTRTRSSTRTSTS